MKKNFFKLQQIFFAVLVAGAIVSCDEENVPTQEPEFTPEELAEMAAADKFAAANSVYRALALIDELPDNWESTTFTPAEGVAVSEAESDIRNVVSTGADHAKSYFLSIVPDLGLNGDTWSHEGVGTLTFRALNEENCYAVIDVNLVQMPGLKELRFVPEAVVGENSFSGEPYYRVGDVIKDKKGIYWICVRPSGGPLKKDYAYFVSFDKSLIKTTTQNQTIYNEENSELTREKNNYLTGKWTYAKNLVEERIAIAAGHTFAMFNGALRGVDAPYYADFKRKAELLKKQGVIDFSEFVREDAGGRPVEEIPNSFVIPYGSYVKNEHTNLRQEKYLQPLLTLSHSGLDYSGYIYEAIGKVWYDPNEENATTPYSLSLTTDYDPLSLINLTGFFYWDEASGYKIPFDIMNYTIDYKGKSGITRSEEYRYLRGIQNQFVMVMTQLKLKDTGKGDNKYELISPTLENEQEPGYWESLGELTHRYYFDKDKIYELVEDIYE